MRKRRDIKVKKVAMEQWSSGDVGYTALRRWPGGMGCAGSGRLGSLERAVTVRWSGVAGLMGCVGLLVLLLVMLVMPVVPGRVFAEEKNAGQSKTGNVADGSGNGNSGNAGKKSDNETKNADNNGDNKTDSSGKSDKKDENSKNDSDSDDTDKAGRFDDDTEVMENDETQATAEVVDDGDEIASAAAYIDSTITLSLGTAALSEKVAPSSTTGGKARVSTQATVRVQNSGGYTVYIGSTSSQLKNGNYAIDTVTANTTYANLPVNRWGYSANQGTTVKDSYSAMPATKQGAAIYTNSNADIADSGNITFTLGFAANIGGDKPTGTYTNSVTVSVVSEPRYVATWADITTMQEMTSSICSGAASGASKQLKDTRDGKFYWVAKLPDDKCWMTQNLDLDLSTTTALTSATSDVSANWTPGFTTATVANSSTVNDASNTETRSWSLGNYRIQYPNDATSCGTKIGDTGTALANCKANNTTGTPNMFAAYTTPTTANGDANAHYILGNHYQWNAATAGTGGSITTGQATSSICPKNWRLPTSNDTTIGSFQGLVNAGSIGSDTAKLTGSPYYFVRGGFVAQLSNYLSGAGNVGYYWSSTPSSDGTLAYSLVFSGTSSLYPSNNDIRRLGFSVRCLAR